MTTIPGDIVELQFITNDPSTGSAVDADSLPTGVLVRNGDDTAEIVTVTNKGTGIYEAAVTVPVGYLAGDAIQIRIAATVGGVVGTGIVWSTILDTLRNEGIASAVWDEIITTSLHNLANSAGKRLRQASQISEADGIVTDVSPTAASFNTDLVTSDNFYNDSLLVFTDGLLEGQARPIDDYTQANGNLSFDEPFTSAPANGDKFAIIITHVHTLSNIAGGVWGYSPRTLTQQAATIAAVLSGSDVTVYRGTTWVVSLTGLGDITAYDNIYLSVKHSLDDPESEAILRVKDDASGLERVNGAAPTAATNGTIVIDDAVNGDITITINEVETAEMPALTDLLYDVKGVASGSTYLLSISGLWTISGDVTRAIT